LVDVPAQVLDAKASPTEYEPLGTIKSVDVSKRVIVVSFEVDPGEPEEVESLSYDDARIEWMVKA